MIPTFIFHIQVLQKKKSEFASEAGVRYDGVYRIEKCWLKVGVQVCIQLNNNNFSPVMYV